MNWIKIGGYVLIIIPTLMVGIVLGFYLIQDYMIFLGEKLPQNHVFHFNHDFKEINYTRSDGGQINALYFPVANPKGLVYYHHGNAGNMESWAKMHVNFTQHGFDVLFYDYRGYGKSTEKIKLESQLYQDAQFVLESFLKDHHYDRMVFHGTSLGTGIAANLATKMPPDILLLETPYYSFLDLIHFHYPYLPASLMSKYKIRTNKYLKEVHCPVFLFHGTDDEIVPHECSTRLAELGENVKLVSVKGGSHNNLPDYQLYQTKLGEILGQL